MRSLQLQDIQVAYPQTGGGGFFQKPETFLAVDRVNLEIGPGEICGLVGESGCGKSSLARALLKLTPIVGGKIRYGGDRIDHLSPRQFRPWRRKMQIVFQDPYSALNPRMTVRDALTEALRVHFKMGSKERRKKVDQLLEQVEMPSRAASRYPHEFSGGQRQRIAIARALALEPEFLIADEPVSALDVSVQAGILNLLARLNRDTGLSILFISHDLAVVRHIAHRIAVMYQGRLLESGPAVELFRKPAHPYTRDLLEAVPLPDPSRQKRKLSRPLEQTDPGNPEPACPYFPRCSQRRDFCTATSPALSALSPGHEAACHFPR